MPAPLGAWYVVMARGHNACSMRYWAVRLLFNGASFAAWIVVLCLLGAAVDLSLAALSVNTVRTIL